MQPDLWINIPAALAVLWSPITWKYHQTNISIGFSSGFSSSGSGFARSIASKILFSCGKHPFLIIRQASSMMSCHIQERSKSCGCSPLEICECEKGLRATDKRTIWEEISLRLTCKSLYEIYNFTKLPWREIFNRKTMFFPHRLVIPGFIRWQRAATSDRNNEGRHVSTTAQNLLYLS